ncbi:MAG: alpha/beta hydrolase [Azospirillum sp.]|nr:alpha/beta hydrolase [Azospirillum sp.]
MESLDWAPGTRAGFVDRPGARLYFETQGAGPAVVFLHGLGGNHLSWWRQAPVFAARHRVVTFAARGFAPSTASSLPPDPADFADDLAALLDRLEIARCALVAQSMGGWAAVEFALANPARVAALVLAATSGTFDVRALDPAAFDAWSVRATAARAALRDEGIHPAAGRRLAEADPALHGLYLSIDALAAAGGLEKEALRARLKRARPPADAAKLACPVLLAMGEEDVVFPSFLAPVLARQIADAREIEFPRAGHSAYIERAAEFNDAVAGFLHEAGWR